MKMRDAVALRIRQLCKQCGVTINALANSSGMPPTTIYSMMNSKSQNPGVVSIKKICDGMDISLREFFDAEIFDDLEQEIQ